jgi:ribonuclease HI
MNIIVHTDGGSRGNPGEAAIGVVIEGNGMETIEIKKRIGVKTNNEAEYMAVMEALIALEGVKKAGRPLTSITFVLDSLLVVSQINGAYKVKQAHLQALLANIRALIRQLNVLVGFRHVLRTENREADRLVNEALDGPA